MHFSPDNFHLQTEEVTGPRMDVFREAILELFEQEHEKLLCHILKSGLNLRFVAMT